MMLIDTHILLWFQLGDTTKLNHDDIKLIMKAHDKGILHLSAISIWEIAMLQKQQRVALHQPVDKWLDNATKGIEIIPINREIALESVLLPNCEHKDPADRLILATARVVGLKLMTKDQKLNAYMKLGYI